MAPLGALNPKEKIPMDSSTTKPRRWMVRIPAQKQITLADGTVICNEGNNSAHLKIEMSLQNDATNTVGTSGKSNATKKAI
jgi:hypothetical protein